MLSLIPLSRAAISRAERADPNQQRCLIENCPKGRAVKLAHVFPRELSRNKATMRSIEWAWNMRKGTLNLDTRRNVFFLGSSMRDLYESGKWALLPAEDIVEKYFTKPRGRYNRSSPLDRDEFPQIDGMTFQYTFLPLCDSMSEYGITRQDESRKPPSVDTFTTHVYPFESLPTLTSHVHPKFVLLRLSELIIKRSGDPFIADLIKTRPILGKISLLAIDWSFPQLPRVAKTDPTFVSCPVGPQKSKPGPDLDTLDFGVEDAGDEWSEDWDDDDDFESPSSDGDSIETAPRHIRYAAPPSHVSLPVQPGKRCTNDLDEEGRPGGRKGKRPRIAKGGGDRTSGDRQCTPSSGWSKEDISSWARGCAASPIPPPRTNGAE